jgi:hypothetical protein
MKIDTVPYQLECIIQGMLNSRDNIYVRGNYRMRLDTIRREIDKAIKKYDDELTIAEGSKYRKKNAV